MGRLRAQQTEPGSTTRVGRPGASRGWPSAATSSASILVLASLAAGPVADVGPVSAAASGHSASSTHGAKGVCEPQVLVLPGPGPTSRAWVTAVSDSGFAVGNASEGDLPSDAVMWTDPTHVVPTGVGGVREQRRTVSAWAVDANESGQVAINRSTWIRGQGWSYDALIWSQTQGATVLPTSAARPAAWLTAINNAGDVIGEVSDRGKRSVPVVWRDGERSPLPVPAGLEVYATDINNAGLVVGGFADKRADDWAHGGWFWDLVADERGRLRRPDSRSSPQAALVDDSGRIVGVRGVGPGDAKRAFLWRNRDARPRPLMGLDARDVHDSGYLAATEPGFRGFGASAYVAHRRAGRGTAQLPAPPDDGGTVEWNNVVADAVARGTSSFAPDGGITIGGYAEDYSDLTQAVLWTCAQTLLRPAADRQAGVLAPR